MDDNRQSEHLQNIPTSWTRRDCFTFGKRRFAPPLGDLESKPTKEPETQGAEPEPQSAEPEPQGADEHQMYNAWAKCSEKLSKRDKERVDAWLAEVDSLLTFASIFSAVITLFIGLSSVKLQPDSGDQTVEYLRIIATQLNATQPAHTTHLSPVPFKRDPWDVVTNSFLFFSLLCCLASAGIGIWVKEWLREYLLDLPYRPRELVRVQELRHQGLKRYYMREMVAAVSFALQLAVVTFSAGMTMMVANLDATLDFVLTTLIAFWTIFSWGLSIGPVLSTHCPFKSPFAVVLYQVHRIPGWFRPRRRFETIVERELKEASSQAARLEMEALQYVIRAFWGDPVLRTVIECFKDMKDKEETLKCIRGIIEDWYKSSMNELLREDKPIPTDADTVLDLLRILREIEQR